LLSTPVRMVPAFRNRPLASHWRELMGTLSAARSRRAPPRGDESLPGLDDQDGQDQFGLTKLMLAASARVSAASVASSNAMPALHPPSW